MPISAKWKHKSSIHISFIVFNGGVTTFFAKSVFHATPTLLKVRLALVIYCMAGEAKQFHIGAITKRKFSVFLFGPWHNT